MKLQIRECSVDDAKSFEPLFKSIERLHRENLPSRFREPPEKFFDGFLRDLIADANSKLFIALAAQQIVGYVHIMIKELPNHPLYNPGQFISVEALAVLPEMTRKGVGSKLMRFAENYAKEKGFSEIELHVWGFN